MAGSPVFAETTAWKIDTEKSEVTFGTFRGTRIAAQGTFNKIKGKILFDSSNISLSKVVAEIPIETLKTGIGARDSDLIGSKYFNSNVCPKATFTSQTIHCDKTGKYVITGLFKLHGIQKTLDLQLTKPAITISKTGHRKLAAAATTAIDQTDYGLTLRLLHPDGFVRIHDLIIVHVSIEASPEASRR